MANVDYKFAVYTIAPSSSQQFTLWGAGSTGVEYFDVSLAVDPLPRHPTQLPQGDLWHQTQYDFKPRKP
jgi:hypothetical protein